MRKVSDRKIMRSLCKSYKRSDGGVMWSKVAHELRKLPRFKKKESEVCNECGKPK